MDLRDWLEGRPMVTRPASGRQFMPIEEYEYDGAYVVKAELPGIDPDKDVEITLHHRMLTIKAERSEEHQDKERSEFRYGTFTRSIEVPAAAAEEEITASYAKGVLTVKVPLIGEQPATRHIEIKRED
ncbi:MULTISPECIES: Hsp20/alpha crystallin family protein [unclassified Streptomyces]|nr:MULTISPECIES: Hsp20/alpha crystallin family protein [unclassified Streptomyces]MBT2407603.1 Hsp20/alpha crystallin family protein [Streptomyces sp. ISL-21]MBT2459089.1 Hsp20/alpha crystallin family protein [Streptomyces sp. ISL-86]MBT2611597.1 Hsp20/alpha crystallin family protein [Streptomyces sp. ISL-87]